MDGGFNCMVIHQKNTDAGDFGKFGIRRNGQGTTARELDQGIRDFEGGQLNRVGLGTRIDAGTSAKTGGSREGDKPTASEVYHGSREE